jgi:WD40 repeat protein
MGHSRNILGVEFCSSSRSLVSTSCNANLVKVWNYETGHCLFTIRDFQSAVFRMALGNGLLFAASEGIPSYSKKSSQPDSLSDDKVFVFNCGWSDKDDVGQILAALPNSGGRSVASMMHVSSHPTVVVSYRDGGISVYKYALPSSGSVGSRFSISHERRINLTGIPFFSLSAGRLGEGFFAGVSPWLYWASFGETAAVTPGGEKFLAPSSEKMNCAHCGLFKGHAQSKKCGGCGNVRFCGNTCLKAGWKSHKAACKAHQADIKKK